MKSIRQYSNKKGVAIVYVTITLIVLLLIIGIAIDGGIGLAVNAKLDAAVDGAALAAGRALAKGGDDATRIANAQAAALKFYYGNFPDGYLRATPATPNIVVEKVIEEDGTWHGKWRVEVKGEATVPTFFLRLAGNKTFTATALAETLRRDLDLALIIDVSSSLRPVRENVKSAVLDFIDFFNEGADRMALITFGDGALVNEPIRTVERGFDKSAMTSYISGLGYSDFNGFTNFGEGFWNGKNQLDSISTANRSSLRTIVFFTDGSPNTVSSAFPLEDLGGDSIVGSLRTCKDPQSSSCLRGLYKHDQISQAYYPYWYNYGVDDEVEAIPPFYNAHGVVENDFLLCPSTRHGFAINCDDVNDVTINRIARNLPEDMANTARSEGIIVYTLGLEGPGQHMTVPHGPAPGEAGMDILKRMANTQDADTYNSAQPSGLFVLATDSTQLKEAFTAIAAHILRLTK